MRKPFALMLLALGCSLVYTAAVSAKTTSADVLNDLHEANQMEIKMGQLAQEKGATDDVRSYGKALVNDHRDNDKKVMDVASKGGITLKAFKPGMMEEMTVKHMRSQSGSDFDRKFAKHMIDDHKKDIAKLQDAQRESLSQDVKNLVADTLPTLQKHLETAQKIYGQPS